MPTRASGQMRIAGKKPVSQHVKKPHRPVAHAALARVAVGQSPVESGGGGRTLWLGTYTILMRHVGRAQTNNEFGDTRVETEEP